MKGPEPATATSDTEVLHRFGYAQQLLRDMGGFSNFAISFSIISILTGAVTLYGVGLNAGGPVVMGIGWPLVTLFVLFVAAALAELASAIPTSGALYHWSAFLGGPTWGWMTAWLNLIGLIAAIAGIDYGCAQFMVPLLGLQETSPNFMLIFGTVQTSRAQTWIKPFEFSTVYQAVTGISTIGLYLFYGIPLLLKLWAIRRGVWTERANGPWSLGNWTVPVNVIALAWIAFITVLFVLPPNELTGFIFAWTFAAMMVFYLARVRGKFRGPVPQARSPEELLTLEAELEQ